MTGTLEVTWYQSQNREDSNGWPGTIKTRVYLSNKSAKCICLESVRLGKWKKNMNQ